MRFSEELDLKYGVSLIVKGQWTPPRPAPMCSNPDSPKFSDPGEPGCVEIDTACLCWGECGKEPVEDLDQFLQEQKDFMEELLERLMSYPREPMEREEI